MILSYNVGVFARNEFEATAIAAGYLDIFLGRQMTRVHTYDVDDTFAP